MKKNNLNDFNFNELFLWFKVHEIFAQIYPIKIVAINHWKCIWKNINFVQHLWYGYKLKLSYENLLRLIISTFLILLSINN